jgi:hypothetical protein
MSIEVLEALACIAEIEREIDNLFRLRPPTERKRIDGTEFVRMRIGSPAASGPAVRSTPAIAETPRKSTPMTHTGSRTRFIQN